MGLKESLQRIQELEPLVGISSRIIIGKEFRDPYIGHVHHTGPLKIFEQERFRVFQNCGMPAEEMAKEQGIFGMVWELTVKYGAQAKIGDDVEVATQVYHPRKTVLTFHQVMKKGEAVVAEAVVDAVLVSTDGKPIAVPSDVLEKLKGF